MRLLIFDLDGTLVDSKQDIVQSVNRAFMSRGFVELPHERIGAEIGRGAEYLFRRLLGVEISESVINDLAKRFREIYGRYLLEHTRIYPGVLEALTHYRNFPKVIVTNKNQIFADRIVDGTGLRAHFEAVFGSEAFTTQKPDPGPIRAVCERWNVHPNDAVLIGDSEFDLIAGKSAGARTVGALYGFGRMEIFEHWVPDHCVESASQLIGLFPINGI